MAGQKVFLSVGGTSNPKQEALIAFLEDRLRSEGLVPSTVGRTSFPSEAPLKAVEKEMRQCVGTVVLALERTYFPLGVERRGGTSETEVRDVCIATSWNQIEAAMSYMLGLPLLVLVQDDVKGDGLLEPGYDWYVQRISEDTASFATHEFNGVLASWKSKLDSAAPSSTVSGGRRRVEWDDLSAREIVDTLKPSHLWSILGVVAVIAGGAFALGAQLLG